MASYLIGLGGSILGIIGIFCDSPTLIVVGGCLCLLETVIGLISGQLRTVSVEVFSIILGLILANPLGLSKFVSVMFFFCVTTFLFSVIFLIPVIIVAIKSDRY